MKKTHLSAALAAALLTLTTSVQADITGVIRDRVADWTGQQSPKSKPISASRLNDSWGDAPSGDSRPVKRAEQLADERHRDERHGDVRAGRTQAPAVAPAREARAAQVVRPVPPRAERPAPARAEAREAAAEDTDIRATSAGGAVRTACINVARVWEGAASWAGRGMEDRAYDTYLRLLSTCTSEKELEGTVWQARQHLRPELLERLMAEPVMASPKLAKAAYTLGVQRMYAANKAKDVKAALAVSRALRNDMMDRADAGALEVSGWLERRERNHKEAERLFRAALRAERDAESAREGLVLVLLSQGKTSQAVAEVQRLEGENADSLRGEVLLAQARDALKGEQPREALAFVERAKKLGVDMDESVLALQGWALRADGKPEAAKQIFERLTRQAPGNKEFAAGYVESLIDLREHDALRVVATNNGPSADRARDAMASRLESQGRAAEAAQLAGRKAEGSAGSMAGELSVRNKSGDVGAGRLSMVVVPAVSGTASLGATARVEVDAANVRADDGQHQANGRELRVRFVSNGETSVIAGAGLSVVPGNTRVTGELRVRRYTDSGYVEGGFERSPMLDSVRAYAGVTLGNGQLAGQVMRTGFVGSGVTEIMPSVRLTWSAGLGSAAGASSPSNMYMEGRVALLKQFSYEGLSYLSAGPELRFASWKRDENRFDTASGGYFSPGSDIGMGLRSALQSQEGSRTLYKASGYLGFASRSLHYGNESGLVAELDASVGTLLGSHLILSSGVSFKMAPGYTDSGMFFKLAMPFEKRTGLYSLDLGAPKFR
jgi:tetratricopeptide (TPR) repeat protein